MFSASAIVTLLPALAAVVFLPGADSHNIVLCTNSKPDLPALLARDTQSYDSSKDTCTGYPRALPANNTPQWNIVSDQGYPWQGIWPVQDGMGYKTHRAVNWLQENPVYDPTHKWTTVKPGATIFIQVQTNNHAHEYAERPSGHYKIYLAGSSMTQLTTSNQLTDDRVVFKAPANKYAHIIGTPNFAGYDGDPGSSWLPLKLVDPTGAPLPAGVYNYVWTYWWASSETPQKDYMVPSYSSGFDIEISEDAEDAGFLTEAVNANPDYHVTLIGNSSSPGSLDKTSPWPPYAAGYLDSNYDGVDPSTDVGKRTFRPYWEEHIDAQPMPAPTLQAIGAIKSWSDDALNAVLPLPPGSNATFPAGNADVGSMVAGSADGGAPAPTVDALGVSGANGTSNVTTLPIDTGAGNTTVPGDSYTGTGAGNTTMPGGSYPGTGAENGTEAATQPGPGECYMKPETNVTVSSDTVPGTDNYTTPGSSDTVPGTDNYTTPGSSDTVPGPDNYTTPVINGTSQTSDECYWVSDEPQTNASANAGTAPGSENPKPADECYWVPDPPQTNTTDECPMVHKEPETNVTVSAASVPGSGNQTTPVINGTSHPSDECHWVSDEPHTNTSTSAGTGVPDQPHKNTTDECTWVPDLPQKNTSLSAGTAPGAENPKPSSECTWVPDQPSGSEGKQYRPRGVSWY